MQKQFYFNYLKKKYVYYQYTVFVYTLLNVKTVIFQAIQFSISTKLTFQAVLFDP